MTTSEKYALQKFFNKIQVFNEEMDKTFKDLQRCNADQGDGKSWCNVEANLLGVLNNPDTSKIYKDRALGLFVRYKEMSSKREVLGDLGAVLAEIGMWS